MDLTELLWAPAESLIPVGWVREHLLPKPDPVLVQLGVALEVASEYWSAVIRGDIELPLARGGRLPHDSPNKANQPNGQMSKRKKWREKMGQKGLSRVTIYNRPDVSPYIYIEWWESGRRIASRLTVNGVPVPDHKGPRDIARQVARRTVEKLEAKATHDFWLSIAARPSEIPEAAKDVLAKFVSLPSSPPMPGSPGVATAASVLSSGTVEELFDTWLARQKQDIKQKGIAARQWKAALGPSKVLKTLSPDEINRKAEALAASKKWSEKTLRNRLNHLRMALEYARRNLVWEGPDPQDVEVSELEIPDTAKLTYSKSEYDAILKVAMAVAQAGPGAVVGDAVDFSVHPTADEALRVAAAVAITATFARRIDQTLSLTAAEVSRTKLLKVDAFEFCFPRATEKAARFKDANTTVATLNVVQHPVEYGIVERLLTSRGVETSGLLFPSVPRDKSLSQSLPSKRVKQETMRAYLRKVEALAGVTSVPRRGFHGLKRLAATQCQTEKDLDHLSKVSNTSKKTLERYHQKLGTFYNQETRRSEEERLEADLARNGDTSD